MNLTNGFVLTTIFLFVIISALLPSDAAAGHKSCRIKAGSDDVYVRVYDRDQDGNPTRNRMYYSEIWRGVIKKGQSKTIKSYYGRIRYDYQSLADNRPYGANLTSCFHGETIRVP
jgi:hypothetical protein